MGNGEFGVKRILLITYHFPPEGGPGTQRAAKFAKYLGEFGWEPIVLTRSNPGAQDIWHTEDATLLGDLPRTLKVVRVAPTGASAWAAAVPAIDVGRDWMESAFDAAKRIAAEESIDAALVTMSPFDLSFLGLRIQDQLGVPVVFDLRDPWALDGWRLRGTKRRWRRDWNAMCRTLPKASGVIANTTEAMREFGRRIPALSERRVISIPNGFDEADFAGRIAEEKSQNRDLFRICHLGTLHCGEHYRYEGPLGWLKIMRHYRPEPIAPGGRSTYYLLRALRMLRENGDPRVQKTRVVLAGPIESGTRRCIDESGVADLVETIGYVSHDRAIDFLLAADALFVPLHGLPAGRRSLIVPGKLYECLRSGRPILGCLPDGEAREMAEKMGAVCCPPCDCNQIADGLKMLWQRSERGELNSVPPPSWLKQFERRELTRSLSGFLDRVVASESACVAPSEYQTPPVANSS